MFDRTSVTTIGVVTANRPVLVHRCLESLVRHCDFYGHRPRFLIIDGSREPADQAATGSAVSAVADASRHRLEYVGPKDAREFSAKLAVPEALAHSLMSGSIGANRNLLLLLTAGEHVLTVDDDVVSETWIVPGRHDGLALMGHHQELFETSFFDSRLTALSTLARTSADILSAHGALLGQSLTTLIESSTPPADLSGACVHLRTAIDDGQPLTVKATCSGLAGDAGMYCPYRLLFSAGPLRKRLRSSATAFATAITSREAFRIVRTNVVTHDRGCMATCMGLSNRAVVPPFLPVGRNEDGVFGAMLAASDAAAVFGHVPVGVLHDSDRRSERSGDQILSASESRLSDLVISVVRRRGAPNPTTSCDKWLLEMGQTLMDIGHLDTRDLAAFVTDLALEERGLELEQLGKDARGPDCPEHWRVAIGRYCHQLSSSMATREFFLPAEFHGSGSIDSGYRALQTFFLAFGRLVASWPALWEAARAINTKSQ